MKQTCKKKCRYLILRKVPRYDGSEGYCVTCEAVLDMKILEVYFNNINGDSSVDGLLKKSILLLLQTIPSFVLKIINAYIYAYSTNKIDNIHPITLYKLCSVVRDQISIEREFIETYDTLFQHQKILLKDFIKIVS